LKNDLRLGIKANNLTAILSNKDFLIGCYQNIKSKPDNMISCLNKKTLSDINFNWFAEVSSSFRNGSFKFKSSRKSHTSRSSEKLRSLKTSSFKDKIIQEGMRILLDAVFEKDFCDSSHAFRPKRGYHTALDQIRIQCGKVNWFIGGTIEQQYFNIDHNILADILREKIQDEPFIDIVYKYMKVKFREKDLNEITPIKISLAQKRSVSSILFNIYMHPFDVWMKETLIPGYINARHEKGNSIEYNQMIRTQEKSIKSTMSLDSNYSRVYYTRYADDFLVGIQESKETCEFIREKIKSFLEKKLALTLNTDTTKIVHSTTDQVLFLGHHISCTPIKEVQIKYRSKKRFVRNVTRAIINAPIKMVVKKLKQKGFLNSKNMPTKNGKYINMDLWNIVENHKAIERSILDYYAMANNYSRLAAKVHYSLKFSCVLTISSKMKLKTMRGVFKKYGKNLTIIVRNKSISYPKISYRRSKKLIRFSKIDLDVTSNRFVDKLKRRVKN